ncbi:hypothetical protein ALC60_09332, partial [Trachymyrmex zeteki]
KFFMNNLKITSVKLILVSEYTKLIQILLTIPVTSCTAERQVWLNSAAILHVHSEIAETLDIDALMDEFIIKNKIRRSTLALRLRD